MQFIKKHSHRKQDINIHWVVGHKDVPGNTKADEEAKKAPSSSNPRKCLLYYLQEDHLPLSVSVTVGPGGNDRRPGDKGLSTKSLTYRQDESYD